jgi:uncharacterized membrane protein
MNETLQTRSKPKQFIATILALQATLWFTALFNVPVARQVIAFVYITFVPGFTILKLLKQDELDIIEKVVFSVGLSIAFLMLVGLVINIVGPLAGFTSPLEPTLLIAVISCFVLVGSALCYSKSLGDIHLNEAAKGTIAKALPIVSLPILSTIGAFWANATGNTSILLMALIATLMVFGIAVFSKRLVPEGFHTIVIFSIAVTLVFQFTLVSSYLYGFSDIHIEYYILRLTEKSGYWNPTASFTDQVYGTYNNMLSITVLPTIYSNMLGIDSTWILKIVFPLIFAFVPLALYLMWREKLGVTIALFSAFLLMSQVTFYTEMLNLARQMIAELFFVLLFIVLFSKKLTSINMIILFMIFSFSLVVSHYSMALIFLFLVLTTWLFAYYAKKMNKNLTLPMIALFSTIMFSWYIYTSASISFETILSFANSIYFGLGNFLNPASRGQGVLQGLGLQAASSTLQQVSRTIAYTTELFIVIGFLVLLLQRKKRNIDFGYFTLCSANMVILALCILLPNFALSLQITRLYHILLFFLAPLFSIGCIACVELSTKTKKKFYSLFLTVTILIAYFLFQTNFVYEVTGSQSWSVPLSRYRLSQRLYTEFGYSTEAEVSGTEWLSQRANIENLVLYTDSSSYPRLYRLIYKEKLQSITNVTSANSNEFVYLGELNMIFGKVVGATGDIAWNTSEISGLNSLSITYTNGYCQIYKNTIFSP